MIDYKPDDGEDEDGVEEGNKVYEDDSEDDDRYVWMRACVDLTYIL